MHGAQPKTPRRTQTATASDLLRELEAATVCLLGIVAITCWPQAAVVALGIGAAGVLTRSALRVCSRPLIQWLTSRCVYRRHRDH
jgi:hypothetical protein